MPLYGTLDTLPLPDLLRWLASSSQTGTLQVERNRVRKWILLRDGEIVGCASDDPPERLGQVLLSRGKVSEDQLRNALAAQEATSIPLGRIFVEMKAVSETDLESILNAKAEETLYSIFDMTGAVFRFQEGVVDQPGAYPIDRSVEDLLDRGIRRRDEIRRIREVFDDHGLVLRRTSARPPDAILANSTARTVYDAIDGRRTIEELLLHVHGSEYLVTKFLFELKRAGFVETVNPETGPTAETPALRQASAPAIVSGSNTGPSNSTVDSASNPVATTARSTAAIGETPENELRSSSTDASERVHAVICVDPESACLVDAPPGPASADPDADDTLDIPEVFQQSSDVEPLEKSVAFQVEQRLEKARNLLKDEQYEFALEALDELYTEFPDDDSLRRLISEAEAAFRDKAYRHYLPAEKIPVLCKPLDELGSSSLSPSEFFLLSRIDGTWDVKSIIKVAPLREIDALLLLKRLREDGLISLIDPS